ncbi:cytochrome P450 81E8 [Morus notabilis]|nr:cytochrome P450 81E8 [Morus notabilis]
MFLYLLYFLVLYAMTKHFLNKIQNLPQSPFPVLPIIGHLYLFKNPLHRCLSKLSDRYGPILFLQFGSRPVLLVSSPSAAEECLTKNDIIFANRPHLLAGKHLGNNYTNLTYASYGDHWRNLRRIATLEILSSHRVQMLSHIRADEVRSLIRQLLRSDQNQAVEMKPLFLELMLNNMLRMVAAKRYYGESVEDIEEAKKVHKIVTDGNLLGGTSNIGDFLPLPKWIFSGGDVKSLIELQKKRVSFMQSLIEERRKILTSHGSSISEEMKTKCMIDVLLYLQESDPESYSDDIIRGLMQTLITSGTDSSAGTMEWAMSLLLTNPEVLKEAQNELDHCVGHDRLVNESDLPKLSYLHCIIKETTRLYPAGPLIPHESSEECTVGGFRIPRGTILLINLWAIQQDPKLWDEPTRFKPKRFKQSEGVMRDGFKYMPFGSGRRGCPSENLAMRMLGLTLASLIQCFEWEVGSEKIDMTEKLGISLCKANSLQAKCRPRPIMANVLYRI